MYFSKVSFCGHSPSAFWELQNLGNIYKEHQLIWKFFPEEKEAKRDFLYRRVSSGSALEFYVVSKRKPLSDRKKHGWYVQSKEYHPKLQVGRKYAFSLRANPIVTKKGEGSKSVRNDIIMEARARSKEDISFQELLAKTGSDWLKKQAPKKGFFIRKEDIFVERYLRFRGRKNQQSQPIQIGAIDYSGILEVKDADIFLETLFTGIGKSRAFGCGLFLLRLFVGVSYDTMQIHTFHKRDQTEVKDFLKIL